jgi:hypothetical protein
MQLRLLDASASSTLLGRQSEAHLLGEKLARLALLALQVVPLAADVPLFAVSWRGRGTCCPGLPVHRGSGGEVVLLGGRAQGLGLGQLLLQVGVLLVHGAELHELLKLLLGKGHSRCLLQLRTP